MTFSLSLFHAPVFIFLKKEFEIQFRFFSLLLFQTTYHLTFYPSLFLGVFYLSSRIMCVLAQNFKLNCVVK